MRNFDIENTDNEALHILCLVEEALSAQNKPRIVGPVYPCDELDGDLHMDAICRAEIAMAIEEWLCCDIPDVVLEGWQYVADIITTAKEHV